MKATARTRSSASEAEALARSIQAAGGKVVFTNGVFDLLHPGHVQYLHEARRLGDALIVGLNSDRSVRAIKAPGRPLNPEDERAEVLLGLVSVDAVVVFDEDTPLQLIDVIKPDVLVKGSDWGPSEIVGRDTVEARGGRVIRIDLTPGFSTTELVRRVQTAR